MRLILACLTLAAPPVAAAPSASPPIEQLPTDRASAKVVLVAGSNYYKPGEHEYVATCAVLMDLLRQTPGVAPVFAVGWPKKPETFAGAKAVVFFFDGGDKHAVLAGDRIAQVQKLIDSGVGLVQLHQVPDVPKDFGDRARAWSGAAWEKGYSQRAHWVAEFQSFPDHPVFRGVTPFVIDDGWLFKLRFAEGLKGVTPLLRTPNPKAKEKQTGTDDIVAWVFERPGDGRTFSFTGGHLHSSLAQEGYRRFLVNGILWAAHVEVPGRGAKVDLNAADLPKYRAQPPAAKK